MAYGKVGRPPKEVKFDHKGPVTQAVHAGVKCLYQNGRRWSYAEFNRFSEKWEPEPRPIDEMDANTTALAFHVGELRKLLKPLIEQFAKLAGVVENLEKLVKDIENE